MNNSDNSHNFSEVEYSFPKINGEEMIGLKCILSSGGCGFASVNSGNMFGSKEQSHEQSRSNARRIAACINYCRGISTEALEDK